MRNDLTDVTLLLDRSGSMSTCREEAEAGVNFFIEEQKKQPGECVFSLIQFDTIYECVHHGVPIQNVTKYELVPRGMTALLDSIGRAINETGERLAARDEASRPGLVIFASVTDGAENSSHEFTNAQVKELIEQQQKDYSWQFTFLGANQDAFDEARKIGIPAAAVANYDVVASQQTFAGVSANITRMRQLCTSGLEVSCCYTDAERASMKGES